MVRKIQLGWERKEDRGGPAMKYMWWSCYEVYKDGVIFKGKELTRDSFLDKTIIWMEYKGRGFTYVISPNPHTVFAYPEIVKSIKVRELITDGSLFIWWNVIFCEE